MTETATTSTDTTPTLFLRAQYIKDLSFENPRAPGSIFQLQEPPMMDVSVNLGAQRLDEKLFEVAIQIGVRATVDKATIFLCDLVYAGVIELQHIPEAAIESTLFIQGAQLIYPFARRVVSDVTRDGGFPPIALEPLDFASMYANQRAKAPVTNHA